MVDIPLDRLLEIGTADLRKNQAEFARVAKQIDAHKSSQPVLQELADDHPNPSQLLQSFRDTFDSLISFIRQKKILTIPSAVRPILEEMPPFARATTTAMMDSPGPLETGSKEAFFYVTLPGPHDSAAEIKERMEDFNRGTIISYSVHETYPGHYVQFLWSHQAPSKTRKILQINSNLEGWAHYCEQMILDEGYGQPGFGASNACEGALIRLGQLEDALLRDARFVVGIQMHTGRMTFDQAVDYFMKEGHQTHQIGLIETKRGTSDPDLSLLHAGKIGDYEIALGRAAKAGRGLLTAEISRRFSASGFPSNQNHPPSDVRR